MPNHDFFTHLGLFVLKDFLDAEFCAKYLSEARSATVAPVQILQRSGTKSINLIRDESQRRTERIKVFASTESFIEARLLAIKPMLESHFNLVLTGCQTPLFYVYKERGFFGLHRDSIPEPDAPKVAHERRVSAIIFLNSTTEKPRRDCYGGGSLTLYGLIDDPRWKPYGFPFIGEPGLLLAFPSDVFHEVKPVTYGERYTIVSWFF